MADLAPIPFLTGLFTSAFCDEQRPESVQNVIEQHLNGRPRGQSSSRWRAVKVSTDPPQLEDLG